MEAQLKESVNQRIQELKAVCKEHEIPIMIAYAEEKSGGTYYTREVVTPLQCNVRLTNDLITPCLLMFSKDFRVIPMMKD